MDSPEGSRRLGNVPPGMNPTQKRPPPGSLPNDPALITLLLGWGVGSMFWIELTPGIHARAPKALNEGTDSPPLLPTPNKELLKVETNINNNNSNNDKNNCHGLLGAFSICYLS